MKQTTKFSYFTMLIAVSFTCMNAMAQTTIANFNFNTLTNNGTYNTNTVLNADATATSITATITNPTTAATAYAGTASGSNAFISNATAGQAIAFSNSSGTNSKYFDVHISGGSVLSNYKSYFLYLQAQRSTSGAQTITIATSVDGSLFTDFGTTITVPDGSFSDSPIDLSALTQLDYHADVYFRLKLSGASTSGTLRIDNLQFKATQVVAVVGSVGPQGPAGPAGPQGATGATGATGAAGSADAWGKTGTAGTNPTSNYVGTSDNADFSIRANNIEGIKVKTDGSVTFAKPITFNDNIHSLKPIEVGNSILIGGVTAGVVTNDIYTDNDDFLIQSTLNNNYNTVINANNTGNVGIGGYAIDPIMKLNVFGNMELNDNVLFIRNHHHGLGWYGMNYGNINHPFTTPPANPADDNIDGPVLFGYGGGALGTNRNISTTDPYDISHNSIALRWNASGQVGIGKQPEVRATSSDPLMLLDVAGNVELNNNTLFLRNHHHGIAYYGNVNNSNVSNYYFTPAHENIDGPVVFGFGGGALGTNTGTGNNGDIANNVIALRWFANGQVGIGTNMASSAGYKLAVNGSIRAKEVVIESGWADFVFEKNYKLTSLESVEKYIEANNHLPDVPSAKFISENGLKVAETQTIMMQKIEELTLYVIEQNKKITELQTKVKELKK
jgi:hypothetical protein